MPDRIRIAELEAENASLRQRLAPRRADGGRRVVSVLHRGRNTLATIRAIVRRSGDGIRTAEDCVMRLDGRLGARARVQAAGIADPSAGVDLHSLLADD